MAMAKSALISLTIMALFGASMAATYNVGDNAGWTTKGNIDYDKWADDKEFRVGDTIVFKYNIAMHDVLEVSEQDYESCNAKAPTKKYNSGADEITLNKAGKHYFICGVPGHCQVGQKVEVEVDTLAPGASVSAAPGVSPTSSATGAAASGTESSPGGGSDSLPSSATSVTYSSTSNFFLAASGVLAVLIAGLA